MYEIIVIKRFDDEFICICYQMFRMFVVKVVFAIRVDVLGEDINVELGMEYRVMLEKRMRLLEEGKVGILGVLGFICQ